MFIGTQYYRAPFPHQRFWSDDFSRIRDAGIDTVQLWCLWGWVESEPGRYAYDDYDRLVELARQKGLGVVLSTIAEIHPFWIHRVVPGSEMITHTGEKVVSTPRNECNVGLTPGGCFDHPRVLELMGRFLETTARRYGAMPHLRGWDCWNELRWNVHADGHVCYCPHTLREFRAWLAQRHGDLAGVSNAWQRRYASWEDVYPGKCIGRPFTDLIEFQRFLVDRATRHMRFRYEALRRGDPAHLISAHCGTPSINAGGGGYDHAMNRGNNWDHADQLDGFGCSHFPFWGKGFDEAGFGARVESIRSANRGKVTWVSELQGGSARNGMIAHPSVDGPAQQRWVISGIARGAKAVIFWCWKDEIFGNESSGFGFDGWDGLAPQRMAAMKKTADFLGRHAGSIDAYTPDPARVGVLFGPDNYYLDWCHKGRADQAVDAVTGYVTALERLRIPYEVVENRHLQALDTLDVLLMPWSLVIPPGTRDAIVQFIRRGGRIVTEAETDAFDELGFYRYPDQRPFMQALGLHDLGRRHLPGDKGTLTVRLGDQTVSLPADNFLTPLQVPIGAAVLAGNDAADPLLVRQILGKGAAYVVGGFIGQAYRKEPNAAFERFIRHVCDDAGVVTAFEVTPVKGQETDLLWRTGTSGARRLLWLLNGGEEREATIVARSGLLDGTAAVEDLVTGRQVPVRAAGTGRQVTVTVPERGYAVLCW